MQASCGRSVAPTQDRSQPTDPEVIRSSPDPHRDHFVRFVASNTAELRDCEMVKYRAASQTSGPAPGGVGPGLRVGGRGAGVPGGARALVWGTVPVTPAVWGA
jgi:hypothetical protein